MRFNPDGTKTKATIVGEECLNPARIDISDIKVKQMRFYF